MYITSKDRIKHTGLSFIELLKELKYKKMLIEGLEWVGECL